MTSETPEHSHYFDHIYLPDAHERNARRTIWVIALTSLTMIVEIVAGFLTGSMALLADGFHMATHAGALAVAAFAYAYARRHARNARFTFGTGKVGDLAGFASAVMLGLASLGIAVESANRLWSPHMVDFGDATVVAVVGLIVNLISAWMLMDDDHHNHSNGHDDHRHSHKHGGTDNNLRAAYLHVLADAVTSVAAIVALLAGRYLGWIWLDPLIGIAGAIIIARWAWLLMKDTASILLDTAEPELAERIKLIAKQARAQISDLHVWRVGPHAHAVIVSLSGEEGDVAEIRTSLHALPNIVHVTVERCPD